MFKYIASGFVVAALGIVGISYFSAASTGNRMENFITAQYEQDQNSLSSLSNKVVEAAQVPEMAKNNLKEVISAAMQGRYGDKGSSATFSAIKEAYPGTLDTKLYTRLQDMIDSGRTDFSMEQKKLIDKVQTYKIALGSPWQGIWLSVAGYPKIDLTKYVIVKSNYSNKTFESGVDEGIKIGK